MSLENDFYTLVLDNLTYLEEWAHGDLSDAAVRRGSPVLRDLLIQDTLRMAWEKLQGREAFYIEGSRIDDFDADQTIELATVSEVTHPNGTTYGASFTRGGLSMDDKSYRPAYRCLKGLRKLSLYRTDICAISNDVRLTRDDVIKFMANKFGGTHWDEKRNGRKEAALENLLAYEISERSALHYEVIAIAQAISASDSTKQLINLLQAVVHRRGR